MIAVSAMFITGLSVYATNDNLNIVKQANGDYMIYINGNETANFEFAFSNNPGADAAALTYYTNGTDGTGDNIAYVSSAIQAAVNFASPTYMWAKTSSGYIVNGVQIDLSQAIPEADLQAAANVTKKIPVNAVPTTTTVSNANGVTITLTVGKLVLTDTSAQYEYQIIPMPNTAEYNNLFSLATTISKFPSSANVTTLQKIQTYSTFNGLYNSLQPGASNANWLPVVNNEILQPADAQNGEQYIVWIKQTKGTNVTIDAQFMTSERQYDEKYTRDLVTTLLPMTGMDYTLEIVFGILLVATITVYIVVRRLENKNKRLNNK